jgi:hypothetical protein
MAFSKFGWGI